MGRTIFARARDLFVCTTDSSLFNRQGSISAGHLHPSVMLYACIHGVCCTV